MAVSTNVSTLPTNTGNQILNSASAAAGLTASNVQGAATQIGALGTSLGQPITFPGITLPSTTNLTPASICGLLNALESYPALVVNKLLKKIALLQRIASIVEQAGDLVALPSLEALNGILTVADITIADYDAIRTSCCFLNLPPVNDNNLLKLISQLQSALAQLSTFLSEHPWSQLGGLQDELDSLIDEAVGSITGDLSGLLGCINTLCAAAGTIQQGLDTGNLSTFDPTGQAYANILTPTQTQKTQSVTSLQSQITSLIGTPVTNPGSFTVGPGSTQAAVTATPVSNSVTTDASGALYVNGVSTVLPSSSLPSVTSVTPAVIASSSPATTVASLSTDTNVSVTVLGTVGGSATFVFTSSKSRKVVIYFNALSGTATYQYPVPFIYAPVIHMTSGLAITSVTTNGLSNVVITGSTTTGIIVIEGI